jgi:hypothetical protein
MAKAWNLARNRKSAPGYCQERSLFESIWRWWTVHDGSAERLGKIAKTLASLSAS